MPRALITGIGGFVGPYLAQELKNNGYEVFGLDRRESTSSSHYQADITDYPQVLGIIQKVQPDFIFHLAGFSSVADSWEEQDLVRKINIGGTENILNAANSLAVPPTVLVVSSSEAYGVPIKNPVSEDSPLAPVSPYGRSRMEQEARGRAIYKKIIFSRSFNHTGPGQPPIFVIPSLIEQAVLAKAGRQKNILVGNLEAVRDFSDVRDVVRAYRLLVEGGRIGESYNVCSGRGRTVREVLQRVLALVGLSEDLIQVDQNRVSPSGIPKIIGDRSKISKEIDWEPSFDVLETTLPDMLKFREQLEAKV